MAKRAFSSTLRSPSPKLAKKPRTDAAVVQNKIATAEAAARVDADPPLTKLTALLDKGLKPVQKGDAVVYWMRMEDMRISDNRALHQASEQAKSDNVPLLVLFTISPQDYAAHDRSPRRVDFTLRNLRCLQASLVEELYVPLHIVVCNRRRSLPREVISLLKTWSCKRLYANIEYEVDELRRDIEICELAKEQGIIPVFIHDKLVIPPGKLFTKQGKPYTVYSPWQRQWVSELNAHRDVYLAESPRPSANSESLREHPIFGPLFDTPVPDFIPNFECVDREVMAKTWPASQAAARQMLDQFLHTKSRNTHVGNSDPLEPGAEWSDKRSRGLVYKDNRDKADRDHTSRLSPYLSAGVISARELIRATMNAMGSKTVEANRNTSLGVWIMEIAWRDFYTHVMAAFPRVSMGRPFQEKYAAVKWETDEVKLQAWKDGRTGVPIVDAAMRQANTMGWMHNRSRMISAMFLCKDLMIDWRLGERYFMQQFVDGDLASNNGGWQWSASTGTDPQPYFRIMNPYLQSEKADPTGDYIRAFVQELKDVRGPEIHNPTAKICEKTGYPRPIVDHKAVRERALRRYKEPGVE